MEPARTEPRRPDALRDARRLIEELPGLVSDRVHVFSLELARARRSLVLLVLMLGAAALCGTIGWAVLCGALVALALHFGIHWGWALFAIGFVHLLAAALLLDRARRRVPHLAFPATQRCLTVAGRRA